MVGAHPIFIKIATTRVLQLLLQDLVTIFLEDMLNFHGARQVVTDFFNFCVKV